MTLHVHISLEQVQGMIENERKATTPEYDGKCDDIKIGEGMQNTSRQRQHYGRVCSKQTITLNSSTNKSGHFLAYISGLFHFHRFVRSNSRQYGGTSNACWNLPLSYSIPKCVVKAALNYLTL